MGNRSLEPLDRTVAQTRLKKGLGIRRRRPEIGYLIAAHSRKYHLGCGEGGETNNLQHMARCRVAILSLFYNVLIDLITTFTGHGTPLRIYTTVHLL